MKFLCLASGDESGWRSLTAEQQRDALAHDAAIRDRGALMSAVQPSVTCVRNADGVLDARREPVSSMPLPLAGFSVIEAKSLDEVIAMVKDTPCGWANGAIEIRELWDTSRTEG